jgi:hypothetical protein
MNMAVLRERAARLSHCPDDGGSNHLRNVGLLLRENIAQYPRRCLHIRRRDNFKFQTVRAVSLQATALRVYYN